MGTNMLPNGLLGSPRAPRPFFLSDFGYHFGTLLVSFGVLFRSPGSPRGQDAILVSLLSSRGEILTSIWDPPGALLR